MSSRSRSAALKLRPAIVDIRAIKDEDTGLGRARDGYEIGGEVLFDLDLIKDYVFGPAKWLGLFAHAPNNSKETLLFSESPGGEVRSFMPTYFKGRTFDFKGMLSCLRYYDKSHSTTHQGLNKRSRTIVTGPAWADDEVRAFNRIAFDGRGSDYSYLDLHGLLSNLSRHSNRDEYRRAFFSVMMLSKTKLRSEGEDHLEEAHLFGVRHKSGKALVELLAEVESHEELVRLVKESVIDFRDGAMAISYARTLGLGENGKIKYVEQVARFFAPDIQVRLSQVPEFLKDAGFKQDGDGFVGKLHLSHLRMLSSMSIYAPSLGHESQREKTFTLEAIACLAGKRTELLNDKGAFVKEVLSLVSAFLGKIQLSASNLKITFGIFSKGLKFVKALGQGGIQALKKIRLKVKGGLSRRKGSRIVNLDGDELAATPPPPPAPTSAKPSPQVESFKERRDRLIRQGGLSPEEIAGLLMI